MRACGCFHISHRGFSTAALVGLTSTATRAAAGTSSRSSSSRFAANSPMKRLTPVRLPPGRARLATKTKPDRVLASDEDDRDRRGCRLGRERWGSASGRSDHGDLSANQIGRQLRQSIDLILRPAVFDRHVLALDIAGVSSGPGEMRAERSAYVSGDAD